MYSKQGYVLNEVHTKNSKEIVVSNSINSKESLIICWES